VTRLRLGVVAESFGLRLRDAFQTAAKMEIGAVEVDVGQGDLAPRNFTLTGRRDFKHTLRACGLELAAVGARLDRPMTDPAFVQEAIDRTCEIVELAADLGTRVIVANLGPIATLPEDAPARAVELEALTAIGHHAENYERLLALHAATAPAQKLRELMESISPESFRVCLDPAGCVMHGFDPITSARELAEFVAHVYLRDAIRTGDGTPRLARLGEGAVPFAEFFASMAEIGYEGYFIINYRGSKHPADDIAHAKRYLEAL